MSPHSPLPSVLEVGPLRDAASEEAQPRGRPRDETLRERSLDAAIEIYAEFGWSGFNFGSVANKANVGRPALYRRWPDRAALLIDAILHATPAIVDEDLGSLENELKNVLIGYSSVLQGNRGRAGQRLYLDAPAIPDVLAAVHASLMGRRYEVVCSAISRAAVRANTLPSVSERMAFGLLLGPVLLWDVAGHQPPACDIDAVVSSVVATLGLAEYVHRTGREAAQG